MMVVFALVVFVHGLIHLLGVAKGFSLAALPQLTQPIAPAVGLLWLLAAALFTATAIAIFAWPRGWWMLGLGAVVVSSVVVALSWQDAKAGALANAIVLVGVAFGFLAQGPFSLRAEYDRDVRVGLERDGQEDTLREADIAHLPAPVQRYLHIAGVVGQPRVRNFRVRMHGRIRSSPGARWIPIRAEQHNFADDPSRLFYLSGSMFGVPVQGYHRYVGRSASMRIKAAALVPVANASGAEMLRSETVTLFNDICLMAPALLVDPAIEWEAVDDRTVRARFTNAGQTIRAELSFNEAGELTNFWSDERRQLSSDGKTATAQRWSTPIRGYRSFGAGRLPAGGEARWHEPEGEYSYIELTFDDLVYNARR